MPNDEVSNEVERSIRSRHMVRNFSSEPIARNEIRQLLDTARRAPAAGNTAAVQFTVLDAPSTVERYWTTTLTDTKRERFRWQGLLVAPVLVMITTRPAAYVERYAEADKARPRLGESTDGWAQPFWWVDAGMVAQNLLLLAQSRALGACLFGVFDHEPALRKVFEVENDRRIVCTLALGHPAPDQEPGRSAGRSRPPLDDVVRFWRPTEAH